MKKLSLISLILTMALVMSACGGNTTKENTNVTEVNKNTVFKEEQDVFKLKEGDVSNLIVNNDTIYVEQYEYNYGTPEARDAIAEETETAEEVIVNEMPSSIRHITGYSFDGNIKSEFSQNLEQNSGAGVFTTDKDNNVYTIYYKYATYENGDDTDKISLRAMAADGSQMWELSLNENVQEGDYFYVGGIFCHDNQQILLDTSRGIEIFDLQGNPVKMIEKSEANESKLYQIREGGYALTTTQDDAAFIQILDLQSGTFKEKVKMPFNYYRYQVNSGKGYDIYLNDEYGVYGYNINDTDITKLMDFISSDFSSNYLYQISFIDENTFVTYYHGDEVEMSKFTKVAPENVVDKTELIVGCYYLDSEVKEALIKFNKNSGEYRLNIRDYSTYDTMDDFTQGMTRLNADIISGDVPDIMILNTQMPFNSYVAKGIFVDLNEFFEKDSEIKKEDFLPNVLEALASEDGLYRIASSFGINTFVAKTKDVGETPGWTMDEAKELISKKPEGTKLLSEVTSSNFMNYTMWVCGEEYVDWDKGECYFDSEGFKKALEYANTLPREIDYTAVMDDESYWEEMETQYRDGKTILNMQYLSSFRDYSYAKQAIFGEDITLIGFPVDEGLGAGMNMGTTMAISALGKNQEIAWEFVKDFLSEENQDSLSYDFPVRISSLKKLEEKAWEKPYTVDENGNKEEYEDTFFINGMDVPVELLSKEETGKFVEYIKSIDKMCTSDDALNNIVAEEAESYFAGQKSVDEVAGVIQSRAKIYINENR